MPFPGSLRSLRWACPVYRNPESTRLMLFWKAWSHKRRVGYQTESNRNSAYLMDQELCCPLKEDDGDMNLNLLAMAYVQCHSEFLKKRSIDYCCTKLCFIVIQKLKIWSLVLDTWVQPLIRYIWHYISQR